MQAHEAQHCGPRCCLFISGRRVNEKDYRQAVAPKPNTNELQSETLIPCLLEGLDKRVAEELGFYVGQGMNGILRAAPNAYVFDTRTNAFLGMATDHAAKWQAVRNRMTLEERAKKPTQGDRQPTPKK